MIRLKQAGPCLSTDGVPLEPSRERHLRIWVVISLFALPVAAQDSDYSYVNRNLRRWLCVIAADRPYVLIDRQIGEVRLMQRKAVLRAMPILDSSMGGQPASPSAVDSHLRRYRPTLYPGAIQTFAFDWEDNLATMANDRCALLFEHGLLLFAHREWGKPRPPWVRIGVRDLVALYDAVEPGVPLIILPQNWKHMHSAADE